MFTHPEIARQFVCDRERQMLADARQRQLRRQQRHPAARSAKPRAGITRRLAAAIVRARVVASKAADTI
jgi:hypothetical protein